MGPPVAVSFMEITEGTDSTEKMPPGKSQTKHIAVVKCKRIHLPKQDFFLYATAIFFLLKSFLMQINWPSLSLPCISNPN